MFEFIRGMHAPIPRRRTLRLRILLILLFAGGVPMEGDAHPAYLTVAEVSISSDGRFELTMRFDTLAFALNDTSARIGNAPMEDLVAGPRAALTAALDDARGRFLHGFRVATGRGPGRVDSIEFPDAAQVLAWKATVQPFLPVVLPVRLAGRLPAGARSVTFRFPDVLMQVVLTVERPGEEPAAEAVEAGEVSTAFALAGAAPAKPVAFLAASGAGSGPAASAWQPDRRGLACALGACLVLLGMFLAGKRWSRGGRRAR
jgi:hypothetical protein